MLLSGFTLDFLFYYYYIISVYIFPYHLCSTTSLLFLSYYTMHVPYLISLTISLSAFVCMYSRHGFQCLFINLIYRYTCAFLCTPFGIHHTTRWGVLTPLDPHIQIPELGACRFLRLLIKNAQRKRDHRQTI